MKVNWTEIKSNLDAINQVRKKWILLRIIRESSKICLAQFVYENIFEGRINGHKGRGKPTKIFIEKMIIDFNQYVNTKRLTINGE